MKKLILFALFLSVFSSANIFGQTFHAIIFANTKSPGNPNRPGDLGIGPSVTVDFERMNVEMTTIAKSIGYQLKKYYYYDTPESFSRNSLENVLSGLSCKSSDIVFFYYSGHGGRAMDEETKFPEMVLKVPYGAVSPSQLYPLYDVYKNIRRKAPRLTIVMGDLCNSLWKTYYRNRNGNNMRGATVLTKETFDVYKHLFLGAKGGFVVASSEPDNPSGCYVFQKDGKYYNAGGNFTASFLCVLQEFVTRGEAINWESLLSTTAMLTDQLAHEQKNEDGTSFSQIPVYEFDLTPAQVPSGGTNSAPKPPVPSNDNKTNQKDDIAYSLAKVCNQSIDKLERIHNIPTAKSYFANAQAYVQVVGFDNQTIVNTCTVESYLNYLSMATNMDQVIVLDIQQNGAGKVTYMKVHEIHYQ